MAEAFTTLLKAALAEPGRPLAELRTLPGSQRRLVEGWNATQRAYPKQPATLHGLVDARIAISPDAVAMQDREGRITYRELGRRVDTLAGRLAAVGIGRGDRIGICMPRRIDLVCAILAVLKTGAAYVPLDPRYPADRIAFIAADAEMALLLAQGGTVPECSAPILDLNGFWDSPAGAHAPAMHPPRGEPDGADLAYIIYTSGSTGQPKGVALEHRAAVAFVHWSLETFSAEQLSGMLGSTSVCFDLSIFEIFVTLSGGGRLLLVEDLFDLPNAPYADEVTLINTVPTAIAELLRLGPLPANARTVTLAGEALPPSTAAAVHAAGVATLWCLWGPTEDTTFSSGEIVPHGFASYGIGGPITNTQAYVLDDRLSQLPIGMPGEIWLAGAGLARGYWKRPDLTAERFLPNPFATGPENAVLYRTGDRGRWLHDGRLDFLGRVDRQVKVRGFRIEPGEVETALLQHPGIAGAVVDAWCDAGGNARLAAWVEGDPLPEPAAIVADLRARLPEHLVPTLIVPMAKLPRLPNGKLDRKALPDPTVSAETGNAPALPPREGLEQSIAAIWAGLLGRAEIGREDNFFALGGDSILAIQAVAKARQIGIALLPRDIFQHPTLAALAAGLSGRVMTPRAAGPVCGQVPLGPIQRWLLERRLAQPQHWNQGVLLQPSRPLDADKLDAAFAALAAQHDGVRARFTLGQGGWEVHILPVGDAPCVRRIDAGGRDPAEAIAAATAELHASFDLAEGPLWGAALIDIGEGGQRLAVAAHHLLVDGVSWRVLLGDLEAVYRVLESGETLPELSRSSATGEWVSRLAAANLFDAEIPHWRRIAEADAMPLPLDEPCGSNLAGEAASLTHSLDAETTRRFLQDAPAQYPVEANDLLLASLMLTVRDWSGQERLRIELESHGRPDLFEDIDLSRTVGWLTALYPVLLDADRDADAGEVLLGVRNTLRQVPHDGVGYGVLRYLRGVPLPSPEGPVPVRFNYLGQIDNLFPAGGLFTPAGEPAGPMQAAANARDTIFDVNAWVSGGKLHVQWTYGTRLHTRATVEALASGFARHLAALVEHCLNAEDAGYTPADFPHMDFSQGDLDDLLRSL